MTGFLFVGGSGRSGTSFFARALGRHPAIAAIRTVETKLVVAPGGLLDLQAVLVESYAPGRALEVISRFDRLRTAIMDGSMGRQRALAGSQAGAALETGLQAFRTALIRDGVPLPQTPDAFLHHARLVTAAIRGAALADTPGVDQHNAIVMEKTPHNLLFMPFLATLEPGARFIHVMRDPRAVAWSLKSMRWGPDTLEGTVQWVTSYCRAWRRARIHARRLGLPLLELTIEDVATDPQSAANRVSDFLDVPPKPDLLAGADPAHLSRGTSTLSSSDRSILEDGLGWLARAMGYGRDIGQRHATDSTREPASV